MEVKVWVEGLQKTICGVTPTTTCQDIVYALAQATGKRGRFMLFEKWKKSEKTLAPTDCLMSVLQQKGEYWHDVQFILRTTDCVANPASHISKSPSPMPIQQIDGITESPFQRASSNGNNQSGKFRKSLTSRGTEYISPKIVKTKSSLSGSKKESNLITGLKENNLPTDLAMIPKTTADPNVAVVAVKPKRQSVSQNLAGMPAPSVSGSLEAPSAAEHFPGNHSKSKETDSTQRKTTTNARNDIVRTIRQHDEQAKMLSADGSYYDKEIALWEEKTAAAAREVEALENQISQSRIVEASVLSEIKELSNIRLDERLKETMQSQKIVETELESVKRKYHSCEEDVVRTKNEARRLYGQVLEERDAQNEIWSETKAAYLEERERIFCELQDLIRVQEKENQRLEEMILEESRLDSTLLAKTLELDSLEESLKKANLEGFVVNLTAKAAPPSSPTDEERVEVRSSSSAKGDESTLPAPPVRKTPYQRLIVLKRNTAHDPQGMWV